MSRPVQIAILVIAAAAAMGGGAWLADRYGSSGAIPAGLEATVLPEARPIGDFRLQDQQGRPFTRAELKGGWDFVFFGYTHCPDVCPTTLTRMDHVFDRLGDDGAMPDFVFVSVDPARDNPERMAEYLAYFNEAFIGATGERTAIDAMTRDFGVMYELGEGENYTVDHSAAVMLVDPQARLRAVFSPPHEPGAIAAQFRRIRDHYGR